MSVYEFTVKAPKGEMVSLEDYKGKVLLIVNTATGCGFTPQYEALQNLYEEHQKDGFEILDFPCNQFGNQAPGTDEEIQEFCTARYNTTFPRFSKLEVNGENADPLYKYLTTATTFGGFGQGKMAELLGGIAAKMDPDFANNGNIKWNFTKFLVGRDGEIIERFEPTFDMDEVKRKVEEQL